MRETLKEILRGVALGIAAAVLITALIGSETGIAAATITFLGSVAFGWWLGDPRLDTLRRIVSKRERRTDG